MAKKEKVKLQKPSTKKEDSKAKTIPESALPPQKVGILFHVVGMGSSAGGLDEMFLNAHRMVNKDKNRAQILLAIEDITKKGN